MRKTALERRLQALQILVENEGPIAMTVPTDAFIEGEPALPPSPYSRYEGWAGRNQPLIFADPDDGGVLKTLIGWPTFLAARDAGLRNVPVLLFGCFPRQKALAQAIRHYGALQDRDPFGLADLLRTYLATFDHADFDDVERLLDIGHLTFEDMMKFILLHYQVEELVAKGLLTTDSAICLAAVEDGDVQKALGRECCEAGWSVLRLQQEILARTETGPCRACTRQFWERWLPGASPYAQVEDVGFGLHLAAKKVRNGGGR